MSENRPPNSKSTQRPSPQELTQKFEHVTVEGLPVSGKVVWQYDFGVTVIPARLVHDPLLSGCVAYFNSVYFRSLPRQRSSEAVRRFKSSFEALIEVVGRSAGTTHNTLKQFEAYVRDEIGANSVYTYWTHLSPVLNVIHGDALAIRRAQLNAIDLERLFDVESRQIVNLLKRKEYWPKITRVEGNRRGDIFENVNGNEKISPLEFNESIRAFCCCVLLEWADIRNKLYSEFPLLLSKLLELKNLLIASKGGDTKKQMSRNELLAQNYASLKAQVDIDCHIQEIFEMAKQIENPVFTEYLIAHYLRISTSNALSSKHLPKQTSKIWDRKLMESSSSDLNLFDDVIDQYVYTQEEIDRVNQEFSEQDKQKELLALSKRRKLTDQQRLEIVEELNNGSTESSLSKKYGVNKSTINYQKKWVTDQAAWKSLHATAKLRQKELGTYLTSKRANRCSYMNSDWLYQGEDSSPRTLVRAVSSSICFAEDLLGISAIEEVCFAWLMATDRHQPSNIALFCTSDCEETYNSITMVIDPKSLKGRNMMVSGKSYLEGDHYKKSSNNLIYQALTVFKQQVERAYDLGVFQETESGLRFMCPTIAHDVIEKRQLSRTHFTPSFNNGFVGPMAMLVMSGSASNDRILKKSSKCSLFMEYIKQVYQWNAEGRSSSISVDSVSQFSVNIAESKKYDSVKVKSPSDPEASFNENADEQTILAKQQFHSPEVREKTYIKRAADWYYTADNRRFGQRVGDEMMAWSTSIADALADSTVVLTPVLARELLGLEHKQDKAKKEREAGLVLEQAKIMDYLVDEVGVVSKEGTKVIVRNPVTLALMIAKRDQIARGDDLSKLLTSNPDRAREVLGYGIFLASIIEEHFTDAEVKEANDLYGHLDFPMNDLWV